MKNRRIGLCLVLVALLVACAGCGSVQNVHHSLLRSLRSPGEIMEKSPEATAEAHICLERKLDTLLVLDFEVVPESIYAGEEVDHRIRYAMCPPVSPAAAKGEVIRSISYNDRVLFQDRSKLEFKAGTWTVDAFIAVPPDSRPGTYVIDTVLHFKGTTIKKSHYVSVRVRQQQQ